MALFHKIVSALLLTASTLMLVFMLLSGTQNIKPFNNFYWFKTDTSKINGAFGVTAWTNWGICDYFDFDNCKFQSNCLISPVDNFQTTSNIPEKFLKSRDVFFYLSRTAFALEILCLVFTVLSLIFNFFNFVNLFSNTFYFFTYLAFISITFSVSFQTAIVVMANNAFNNANMSSSIGYNMMIMIWFTFICIFIVWVSCTSSKLSRRKRRRRFFNEDNQNLKSKSYERYDMDIYPPTEKKIVFDH